MTDKLSDKNLAGEWASNALTLLSGDYKTFVGAILQPANMGRFDDLIGQIQTAMSGEWRSLSAADSEAALYALRDVLVTISSDLNDPALRPSILVEAVEDSDAWQHRLRQAPQFVATVSGFGADTDLAEALNSAIRLLAEITGQWVRINLPASELTIASAGEQLRRTKSSGEADKRVEASLDLIHKDLRAKKAKIAARLLRSSNRMASDLGASFAATSHGHGLPSQDLYVTREVQETILDRLHNRAETRIVVTGDAGFGKSSLIWGTARSLADDQRLRPVLVSATWLPAVAGAEARFTVAELIDGFAELVRSGPRPVMLLDTADLLLHSDSSIDATEELLDALQEMGVSVVVTVRPVESDSLDSRLDRIELSAYNANEMDRAATALMRQFFPAHPEIQGVDFVRSARARQLPVLEVLQSPLLLRLLFELAGDSLPTMEIDVTGVYWRYWARRVADDCRTTNPSVAKDLSSLAKRVGIVMLAEGSPDLDIDTLVALVERVEFPEPVSSAPNGIAMLAARGVLIDATGRRRFFHQTLFEFAAAQGLAHRGGADEARRLVERVIDFPLDLFVGAVLEQMLILLGSEQSSRQVVAQLVAELLATEKPTIVRIGLVAWAHCPGLEVDSSATIAKLPAEALQSFLTTLPQVSTATIAECANILELVWLERRDDCQHYVVRTMARLARRDPEGMSALFERLDIIGHFSGPARPTLTSPEDLYELLFAMSNAAPDLVRATVLRLIENVPAGEARGKLLDQVAQRWSSLGSDGFFNDLVSVTVRSSTSEKNLRVREALGHILYSQEQLRHGVDPHAWIQNARESMAIITPALNDVRLGASLAALARHLISLGPAEEKEIEEILDEVFRAPATTGPPRLAELLIVPVLASSGTASDAVSRRLATLLQLGLPVPRSRSRRHLTEAQNWALLAILALGNSRVEPALIVRCTSDLTPSRDELWCLPEYLLSLLPATATAGASTPRRLVKEIGEDAHRLTPGARRIFAEAAQEHVHSAKDVADACVNAALASRSTGALRNAATSPMGLAALRGRATDIRALIQILLVGGERQQRSGVSLWTDMQVAGVLAPTLAEIEQALSAVSSRLAKVHVLKMISNLARFNVDVAAAALPTVLEYADLDSENDPQHTAGAPQDHPEIIDAALALYRIILACRALPDDWATLKSLVFEGRAANGSRAEPRQLLEISTYIRRVLQRDDLDRASVLLAEIGEAVGTAPYSDMQRRSASAILHGVAHETVVRGSRPQLLIVLGATAYFPKSLAERTIRSSLLNPIGRSAVEAVLESGRLSGGIAAYAARKLSGQPREIGLGALPEIMRAATRG